MTRYNGYLRDKHDIARELTRVHDDSADINQKHPEKHWSTFTELAWRPAWSIRSRRGALRPLLQWIARQLPGRRGESNSDNR